jgi:hypothetical protein
VGDTNSQAPLPCNAVQPQGTTLYNYDADIDTGPGRHIAHGGSGPYEADINKYQSWRTGPQASNFDVSGTVIVEFWAAMEEFRTDRVGVVRAYLLDVSGGSTAVISEGTTVLAPSSGGWHFRGIAMQIPQHTVAAGHQLEVKIIVQNNSQDHMWFAYDTAATPSRVAGY